MKISYLRKFENDLMDGIGEGNCILCRHCIPNLFWDHTTKRLHSGINQLMLGQYGFRSETISLTEAVRLGLDLTKEHPIVTATRMKGIAYTYSFSDRKIEVRKISEGLCFNFNRPEEIIRCYLISAINGYPYSPRLDAEKKGKLYDYILTNPSGFIKTTNQIFDYLTEKHNG